MTEPSPLIQILTPDRWAGLSMNFIDAGFVGLLVKNGQLVRKLEPGRHFSFALPYLEQCQIILVDSKIRHLEVISQGDLVSQDQYLVNISLSVMYQVIDPKRVALDLSDPIAALTSAIKDNLGVIVNQLRLDQLNQAGRVQIRDYLLSHLDSFYTVGINLDDVRVSDINFPQKSGIIRQLEGLTSRAEAEHQAMLQAQFQSPLQRQDSDNKEVESSPDATLPPAGGTFVLSPAVAAQLGQPTRSPLPPTTLAEDTKVAILINLQSRLRVPLSVTPFTIGREADNRLVADDSLCSRHHACIDRRQDSHGQVGYQLTDVGSSNGTYLNGQRLTPHQPVWLKTQDRIKMGNEEWLVVTDA
jgi:hypothetical protein